MPTTLDAKDFQAELRRLDSLLQESGRFTDPAAQAHARALVQAVLGLHAAGLERVLSHLEAAGKAARPALDACIADEVVSGLLLLHGLHPLDLEERVREALGHLRPTLQLQGGAVELVGVEEGVVRLRLVGDCESSAEAIRQTIEEAINGRAPDAAAVEIEGLPEVPAAEDGHARVPLPML